MSVLPLENTGELHLFAEAYDRVKHDPRQPGPLDYVLAASALAALFVVGLCALILVAAPDHYPVDSGRVLLTMAAAGTCTGPVLAMGYFLNRAQRRRHTAVMEKLDRIRCGCTDEADGVDRKDLAMRSFETGRRIGRRDAEG